jgi:glycosyltransferase involved in cell wall biosynthesis
MERRLKLVMMIRQMIVGGAEREMITLVSGLDRQRYDIHLCLFTDTCVYQDFFREQQIPVTVIPKKTKFDFGHLWRLTAWLRRLQPDIVHTWITEANSVGTVAALLAGVPVRVGCVLNVNFWKTRPRRVYDHFAMGASHRLVTNSLQINEHLARCLRLSPARMKLIYNGIDTRDYRLEGGARHEARRSVRQQYGIGEDETLFIIVAGLRRMKNHLDFLRTINELPRDAGFRFLFLGEGELQQAIEESIQRFDLGEAVILAGARHDVGTVLAGADVFVLPSIIEGLPFAILEAMTAGLPVITTDVGGNGEAVEHERQGLVVPFSDRPAMVDALVRLGTDTAERARMGGQGPQRVEELFTVERMVASFEELYKELTNGLSGNHRQEPGGNRAWEN